MSNSVALNVPRAIFSAFAVGSMKTSIIVTLLTSVRTFVGSVKMSLDLAVHRMSSSPYSSLLLKKVQRRASWQAYVGGTGDWITNATFSPSCSCVVNAHLCGEPCKLSGKRGCLEDCTKVSGHYRFLDQQSLTYLQVIGHAEEDDHMCSAPVHMCGEVWSNLRSVRFLFTIM